jgi:CHAD domain-containing protein
MAHIQDGTGPATPVGVAAVTVLSAKMQPLFELEGSALSGTDMDAVHDMRVASRRTREAIAIFAPLYRDSDIDEPLRSVKAVTKALGAVRDADVFIDHLAELARDAEDEQERLALAYFISWRQAERSHDLDRMRRKLARVGLDKRRVRLTRALYGFKKNADIIAPLGWLAQDVLGERLNAFYSHLPAALDEAAIGDQHAMRIAGKHLRYAIETFKSCIDPKRFDALRGTITSFQDALGEMRDRDVFLLAIGRMIENGNPSAAGVAEAGIGAVRARLAAERAELFQRFGHLVEQHPEDKTREAVMASLLPAPPRPAPPAPQAQAPRPGGPEPAAAQHQPAERPRLERERFAAISRLAQSLFGRRERELPPSPAPGREPLAPSPPSPRSETASAQGSGSPD